MTRIRVAGRASTSQIGRFSHNTRVYSLISTATISPNVDEYDLIEITAQNQTIILANPVGKKINGNEFLIRLRDNGTPQPITFGNEYRANGVMMLPTTTVAGGWITLFCVYNKPDNRFDVMNVTNQFLTEGLVFWEAGVFPQAKVFVLYRVNGIVSLFELNEALPRPYVSSNFLTELANGDWKYFSSPLDQVLVSGNDAGAAQIKNLADPTDPQDADTKAARDAAITAAVIGLWDDRGNYNPNTNANQYPTTGGSGAAGAILKGDIWTISGLGVGVTAAMGGETVQDGDTTRAIADSPGQTDGNWAVGETNIGYEPENVANKATDFSTVNNTLYPTVQAVVNYVAGAASSKLSSILAADATNTINNLNFAQEWQWNTLAGGTGLKLSSTSIAAAGDTQTLFEVNLSGANTTPGETTHAARFINTHSGVGDNIAGYFSASGGSTNYAIQAFGDVTFGSGGSGLIWKNFTNRLGIGTPSPSSPIHIVGSSGVLQRLEFTSTLQSVSYSIYQGAVTVGFITGYGSAHASSPAALALSTGQASGNIRFQTASFTNAGIITNTQQWGIGTMTPATNAILDVSSTTMAAMLPRMTTAQRDLIGSPSASMIVYNTTTGVYNYHNGSSWGIFGETSIGASGDVQVSDAAGGFLGSDLNVVGGTMSLSGSGSELLLLKNTGEIETIVANLALHASNGSGGTGSNGFDVTITAGNGSGTNPHAGGNIFLNPGVKFGANTDGNTAFNVLSATWNGMEKGIFLGNATAEPVGNPTNGIYLWAFDVAASSELRVRDEAGTVTTLSPHNFSLLGRRSEDMAWSHYSERKVGGVTKKINVDMLAVVRAVEELTGKKFAEIKEELINY